MVIIVVIFKFLSLNTCIAHTQMLKQGSELQGAAHSLISSRRVLLTTIYPLMRLSVKTHLKDQDPEAFLASLRAQALGL